MVFAPPSRCASVTAAALEPDFDCHSARACSSCEGCCPDLYPAKAFRARPEHWELRWRGHFVVFAPRFRCAVGNGGGIEGQILITILRMLAQVARVAAPTSTLQWRSVGHHIG